MAPDRSLTPAWVWGVDLSASRFDFAFVHQDGSYQHNAVECPAHTGAARLAQLFQTTRMFARAVAEHFPPLIVYVERPTGQHPNPALDHAAGVAQAAIYDGLSTVYRFPVDVQLVAVKDWRKKVLDNGNASKDDVLEWALARGYKGGDHNVADALGVAACAAQECSFGPGPLHPRIPAPA